MVLDRTYPFTMFVGAVTMDVYQEIGGDGVVYSMGCTHGYDRQSLHLASRYPRKLPLNHVLGSFPNNIWLAIIMALFLIIATFIFTVYLYSDIGLVRSDLDTSSIFLQLVAGFVAAPSHNFCFKTLSTGI